jgi:hypothetical protein
MNEKLKKILKKIFKVIFIICGIAIMLYIILFIGLSMLAAFVFPDPLLDFDKSNKIDSLITMCLENGRCWDDKHNRCVKNDDEFCIKSEAKCKTNDGIWLDDIKYYKFVKNNNNLQ